MKQYKEFILEMSQEQSMSLFGFTKSFTSKELNSTYKKLAKLNHPDAGGTEERMKQINQARDILKKHANTGTGKKDKVLTKADFVSHWKNKVGGTIMDGQFILKNPHDPTSFLSRVIMKRFTFIQNVVYQIYASGGDKTKYQVPLDFTGTPVLLDLLTDIGKLNKTIKDNEKFALAVNKLQVTYHHIQQEQNRESKK